MFLVLSCTQLKPSRCIALTAYCQRRPESCARLQTAATFQMLRSTRRIECCNCGAVIRFIDRQRLAASGGLATHNVCGGSQIVAELKEFPVRRTKTSPLPIR